MTILLQIVKLSANVVSERSVSKLNCQTPYLANNAHFEKIKLDS
jgi:hypothetical protein